MATWMKDVYSSNVREVGYDSDTQDLIVVWKSGKRSAYHGVSEEMAMQVANAPSVGSMLNADIKNSYPHRYV